MAVRDPETLPVGDEIARSVLPVDELDVVVLIDVGLDMLSTTPGSVASEIPNILAAGATEISGHTLCCAVWGLSLLITARSARGTHRVLFDAGPDGGAFERNADRLGVDLTAVDAVVLSHGHWDHAGALPAALRRITGSGDRRVDIHVHDDMFVTRGVRLPDGRIVPFGAVPGRGELTEAGGNVVSAAGAHTLADDLFYLSGEIPRVTAYEQGLSAHVVRDDDGTWSPDPLILDERFLAVRLRGRGIVVFSSCSHAGVVNVLTHAREVFGEAPVHAIFGGLHLAGATSEQWIPETVRDLARFDLAHIIVGHCTGWRATRALMDAYGERVTPTAVAQRHRL